MKNVLLILALLLSRLTVFAQDTIVKRNNDAIAARVLKITPTEVEYKRFDNPDGPLFIVLRSEIARIIYQNGTKDVFNDEAQPVVPEPYAMPVLPIVTTRLSQEELFMRGRQDAMLYYKGNGALWGTALPTIAYPPVGLAVGLVMALTPPKTSNFVTSDIHLLREPSYLRGYKKQAHKKKAGKVAAGVGVAVGFYTVLVLVLLAAWTR